jgi:ectoine hydroxylase
MFHGNLVHASAPNITPYPRKNVSDTVRGFQPHHRYPGWFIAHRDFTPIQQVSDDASRAPRARAKLRE